MIKFFLAIILFGLSSWADIDNKMSNMRVHRENGKLTIDLTFDEETKLSEAGPELAHRTIQFDIMGAQMTTTSKTVPLKDAWLKSVYIYNLDPETIRLRIHAKAKTGKELQELFKVTEKGRKIKFQLQENTEVIDKPVVLAAESKIETKDEAAKAKGSIEEKIVNTSENEKPMFQAAKLVASEEESTSLEPAAETDSEATAVLSAEESEPIAAASNDKSQTSQINKKFINVIIAVSLLGVALISMAFFMRKWKKVSGVDKHVNNIKVLSQHYLGPKKSLCVIRVAGETLLVGVTDNNINLIKSLSLIDDEIPDKIPMDFAKTLREQDPDMPEGYKLTHINDVKKFISRKYSEI